MQWAPDADQWHRLWSVRVAVLGAAVTVGSVVFPGLLSVISPIDHPVRYAALATGFFVLILVSRLVDQPSLDGGK